MNAQEALQLAMGPGGAIATLLLAGWTVVKYGLPFVEKRFEESRQDLTRIMDSHDADRKVYADTMGAITGRLDRQETKIDAIGQKVDHLTDEVDGLRGRGG